jgi:hypothetical protein
MQVFEILCLAASYKMRGTCVAGIRTDGGGWIRPCGHSEHGELHPTDYELEGGGTPRVLDVLKIEFEDPDPLPHQPENWLVAAEPWQLIDRGLTDRVLPLLQSAIVRGPEIFGDTAGKIAHAQFARTPAAASLALIEPTDLHWAVYSTPANVRKPRAIFKLKDAIYRLPVTDPVYVPAFRNLPVGEHPVDAIGIDPSSRILLSVSLSEPFADGYCYKIVAAIISLTSPVPAEPGPPMDRAGATWIVDALARGVDPYTGEPLPADGPFANPDTRKALLAASAALRAETYATPAAARELPANAGKSWDVDEEEKLAAAFDAGSGMKDLAAAHGRTPAAIKSRLIKLGKIERDSEPHL